MLPTNVLEGRTNISILLFCLFFPPLAAQACSKCATGYFTRDGEECEKCPAAPTGSLILLVVSLVVVTYVMHRMSFEEQELPNIKRPFDIIISHYITLGFTFASLPLPHLPKWLTEFFYNITHFFMFDISGLISSPQCEWEYSTVGIFMMKMLFPILMLLFFAVWYAIVSSMGCSGRCKQQNVPSLFLKLWTQTVYILVLLQIFTAWDCTKQEGAGEFTLDMDPSILCNLEKDENYRILFWTSFWIFFPFYGLFSLFVTVDIVIKRRKNLEDEEDYDFKWFDDQFRDSHPNWEVWILLRKFLNGWVGLALTNRLDVAIPLQLTFCVLYLLLLHATRPYKDFDDDDRLYGPHNLLDIFGTLGEMCFYVAGIMNYNIVSAIEKMHEDAAATELYTIPGTNTTNATEIKRLQSRNAITTNDMAKYFESDNAVAQVFEWLACIILAGVTAYGFYETWTEFEEKHHDQIEKAKAKLTKVVPK